MEQQISEKLMSLGIRPDMRGYHYLLDAVKTKLENPLASIHKDVYGNISEKFQTTPSRVERAIRHSIEVAYQVNSPAFGELVRYWHEGDKPTNGWMMSTLAEMCRIKMVS